MSSPFEQRSITTRWSYMMDAESYRRFQRIKQDFRLLQEKLDISVAGNEELVERLQDHANWLAGHLERPEPTVWR